jgi:hypothetical protein
MYTYTHSTPGKMLVKEPPGLTMWDYCAGLGYKKLCQPGLATSLALTDEPLIGYDPNKEMTLHEFDAWLKQEVT